MAQDFSINFSGGVADPQLIEYGTYNLSFSGVDGYANATIQPSSLTVDSTTRTLGITLTADGSATVTVTGSDGLTPVSGVVFNRYLDSSYATAYPPIEGAIDRTNEVNGIYVIKYLPYVVDATGINVYFKLTATGYTTPTDLTLVMKQQTGTTENVRLGTTTVSPTFQDASYTGFPLTGGVAGTAQ